MHVHSETIQPDASAFSAVVEVRGVTYIANYVAGRLNVGLAPYKRAPRRPRWAIEHVRQWAANRVAELPAEWHAAHNAMYAQAA